MSKKLTSFTLIFALFLLAVPPSYAAPAQEEVDLALLQHRAVEDVKKFKNSGLSATLFLSASMLNVGTRMLVVRQRTLVALRAVNERGALQGVSTTATSERLIKEGLSYAKATKNKPLEQFLKSLNPEAKHSTIVAQIEKYELNANFAIVKQSEHLGEYMTLKNLIKMAEMESVGPEFYYLKNGIYEAVEGRHNIKMFTFHDDIKAFSISPKNPQAIKRFVKKGGVVSAELAKASKITKGLRVLTPVFLLAAAIEAWDSMQIYQRIEQNLILFLNLDEQQLAELAQDQRAAQRIKVIFDAFHEIALDPGMRSTLEMQQEKFLKTIDLNTKQPDLKKYGVVGFEHPAGNRAY